MSTLSIQRSSMRMPIRKHFVYSLTPLRSFPVPANLASPKAKRAFHEVLSAKRDVSSTCSNGTTPACLQDLYQIPTTPATNRNNSLGVTGFFGNIAHYAYLEKFLQTYRPDMNPATNFTVVGIDGGVNDQGAPSVSEGVRVHNISARFGVLLLLTRS